MIQHKTRRFAATLVFAFTVVLSAPAFSGHPVRQGQPVPLGQPQPTASPAPDNPAIQFGGFVTLAQKLQKLRDSRRVSVETFVAMAQEPNTVILDTRSKAAFDEVHVAGAIHLNFSDFTDEKLNKTIASKQTRILIYCNNNFIDEAGPTVDNGAPKSAELEVVLRGIVDKRPALALNIPTFINLHGYGYKNVYELADRLRVSDPRISLAGTSINDGN
ncbi:MAG: rhodanese-like domain-containing protein [Planctomycetota bacterium]